jgi:hypothetical protein
MKLKSLTAALAIALAAAAAPTSVFAAPTAVVEGVQMPAWVERAGVRQPIAAGMELKESDRVVTGQNSRLLLRLAEGSQVKLGENAQLTFDKLGQRPENKSVFLQGVLDVARGAFRFTTDVKSKLASRREVDIRVATVTAGIRGTDLWGKSAGDRDIVCLIEGKIQVQREAEAPVPMDQALQFYIAPKGSDGKADSARRAELATVDMNQLQQWAAETEIAAGQGAARRGGKFTVVAAASGSQDDALKVYDQLRAAGYAAEIFPAGSPEKRVYEVRIGGLPSKAEANALGVRLEAITGSKARGV